MSRLFDETMTILILHFLRFSALKNLTGDYFCVENNQIIYIPNKKLDVLLILVFFPALFLQQFFPLIRIHKQLHKNVSLLKMLRNEPILIKRSKT